MDQIPKSKATRREFLRGAAVAGAAAASVMPTTAHAMARVLGANDRINVAHVGLGVQGFGAHVRLIHQAEKNNNTQQIAACDLYGRRLRQTQNELKLPDSALYTDHVKMFENKDIDAVVVATSDSWHAEICIDAMNAGKHVYCEKPMCKTIAEIFRLYDTVKKTGRIFQVGSQGCSDEKYKAVAALIKAGKIGHIVVAQGNYMRGDNKIGEWNNYGSFDKDAGPLATGDAHVDWETFRKGTKPIEWDPDRFFRWRKYWEYGSGLVGDLFPHKLHPLFLAMGLSTDSMEGWPVRVSSGGGLYVQKINHDTGKMDREVPDFINLNVDFSDASLMAMSSTICEQGWPDSIRGNKATVYFSGDRIEVKPDRGFSDEIEPSNEQAPGNGEHIETHEKNWLDCIRTNGIPNCNIDVAARVQVMITLAERSERESRTFVFDPRTRLARAL